MLKIKHVAVCMLALAMLSAGCTNYSGNTYSGSQVRSAQTVQYGTVVSVQPVTLEEDRPAVLGTVGGGVVGGVLGSPRRGWRLCWREGADQAEWPRNYGRTGKRTAVVHCSGRRSAILSG